MGGIYWIAAGIILLALALAGFVIGRLLLLREKKKIEWEWNKEGEEG